MMRTLILLLIINSHAAFASESPSTSTSYTYTEYSSKKYGNRPIKCEEPGFFDNSWNRYKDKDVDISAYFESFPKEHSPWFWHGDTLNYSGAVPNGAALTKWIVSQKLSINSWTELERVKQHYLEAVCKLTSTRRTITIPEPISGLIIGQKLQNADAYKRIKNHSNFDEYSYITKKTKTFNGTNKIYTTKSGLVFKITKTSNSQNSQDSANTLGETLTQSLIEKYGYVKTSTVNALLWGWKNLSCTEQVFICVNSDKYYSAQMAAGLNPTNTQKEDYYEYGNKTLESLDGKFQIKVTGTPNNRITLEYMLANMNTFIEDSIAADRNKILRQKLNAKERKEQIKRKEISSEL